MNQIDSEKCWIGNFPFNILISWLHIKGIDNIPTNVFSRLVPWTGLIVNKIVLSWCTTCQHDLIKTCHQHHYAPWGCQSVLNPVVKIWLHYKRFHYYGTAVCSVHGCTNCDRYYWSIPNMGLSNNIVMIDTFSRYIELFHTTDVTENQRCRSCGNTPVNSGFQMRTWEINGLNSWTIQ